MSDEPRLVVPENWVIEEISQLRLVHQLRRAPAHIAGVVAPSGALAPGASHRVHAERLALQPMSAVSQHTGAPEGAILLRPGVEPETVVGEQAAPVLVDHGAHTHDPGRDVEVVDHASPLGRSPFPWRPLALLLCCGDDPDRSSWAGAMTDSLLAHDVEGRLAATHPTAGPHLSVPCLPSAESVEALRPDVVVALDDEALDVVDTWLGLDRSAVVLAFDAENTEDVTLVPWTIGNASGRLRARIGPSVDAPTLATLVARLCGGPHPVAPAEGVLPVAGVAPAVGRTAASIRPASHRSPQRRRTIVALTGVVETAAAERLDALGDAIAASGDRWSVQDADGGFPPAAFDAPVLILRGVAGAEKIQEIIGSRQRRGLATVVDLGPSDVSVAPATGIVDLHSPSRRLVEACGLAITPSPTLARVLQQDNTAVKVVPGLLGPTRHAALAAVRPARRRHRDLVVGWHVGAGTTSSVHGALVARVAQRLIDEHPDLRLHVVGDPGRMPTLLHGPQVTMHPGPAPAEITRDWTFQVWTPDPSWVDLTGDRRPLVDASCLGVPTLLAHSNPAVAAGEVVPALVVADEGDEVAVEEAWFDTASRLLGDDRGRDRISEQILRRAEVLYGPAEAVAAAKDLLDWAIRNGGS